MDSAPGPHNARGPTRHPTPQSGHHCCTSMDEHLMHLLHVYIAEQLARHLNNHRVVVWYDPRSEFEPFVSELGGKPLSATVSIKSPSEG